jgi:Leucine-rich repeat (LRR) protein
MSARRVGGAGGAPSENEIEAMLQTALQSRNLNLSGISLSSDLCLFIVDCIVSGKNLSFEKVSVDNCKLSPQGFEALITCAADFKNIEILTASSNGLPKEAGFCVSKLLGARGKLKILDLSSNNLSDVGVASISGAFTTDLSELEQRSSVSMLSLMELNLSCNSFGDMGILALCRGLTHFTRHATLAGRRCGLRSLKLENNNVGDKGALCLAQLLVSCSKIHLSTNATPRSPSRGYDSDFGILKLEQLILNRNPIGPQGMIALLGIMSDESSDGSRCYLTELGLANCKLATPVLDGLIANLHSSRTVLSTVDLEIGESFAAQMLAEDASAFNDASLSNSRWTNCFRKLSEAIVGCGKVNISINLGALPRVMLLECQRCKEGGDMHRFYDLVGALDAMSAVADALGLTADLLGGIKAIWSTAAQSQFPSRQLDKKQTSPVVRSLDNSLRLVENKDTISAEAAVESRHQEFSKLRTEHSVS